MSYEVMKLVRQARLPRTMKRRPETKAVLETLAFYGWHDGTNAWPSVSTIVDEVETCARTVQACLKSLQQHGLIEQQQSAGQHRPRTWRLNLEAIRALSGPHAVAGLAGDSDGFGDSSGPQNQASAPQNSSPGPQELSPAPQTIADDLLSDPLSESVLEKVPRAARASSQVQNGKPDDDFPVIVRIVETVFDGEGFDVEDDAEVKARVKDECGRLHVPYDGAVIGRAISIVRIRRMFRRGQRATA